MEREVQIWSQAAAVEQGLKHAQFAAQPNKRMQPAGASGVRNVGLVCG